MLNNNLSKTSLLLQNQKLKPSSIVRPCTPIKNAKTSEANVLEKRTENLNSCVAENGNRASRVDSCHWPTKEPDMFCKRLDIWYSHHSREYD